MPAETLPGPVGVVSAPWRLPGFHWHVYRRDAVGPAWPTPEERAAAPPLVPVDRVAEAVLDLVEDDTLAGRVLVCPATGEWRLLPAERGY